MRFEAVDAIFLNFVLWFLILSLVGCAPSFSDSRVLRPSQTSVAERVFDAVVIGETLF